MRHSPFRLAVVVIAVAGAALTVTRTMTALADDSVAEAIDETLQVFGRLNPNDYRAEIEAVERAVYSERGPYYGSEVASAARELSDSIGLGSEDSPGKRVKFARHSAAIHSFGDVIYSAEEIGSGGHNGDYARTEWERVRASAFAAADWYQTSPTRLEGSVVRRPKS